MAENAPGNMSPKLKRVIETAFEGVEAPPELSVGIVSLVELCQLAMPDPAAIDQAISAITQIVGQDIDGRQLLGGGADFVYAGVDPNQIIDIQAYSLGNALFDQDGAKATREGAALDVRVDAHGVASAQATRLTSMPGRNGYAVHADVGAGGARWRWVRGR